MAIGALVDPTTAKASNGSRLAFDLVDDAGSAARSGERILVLERDTGVTRLAELHFGFTEGEALFGSREDLLNDWILRLQGPSRTAEFIREGF